MKYSGQFITVVIAGLLAIVGGWFYQAQLSEQESDVAELEIPDNIDYYFTDMTYRAMTSSGALDYQFNSPRMEHRKLGDTSHIKLPEVTIYRGDNVWLVNAEVGQLFHETEAFHLEQQVEMFKQGRDPMRLSSEKAVFHAEAQTIQFPQAVIIQSPEATISAASAELDMENNVYRFQQTRTIYRDEAS